MQLPYLEVCRVEILGRCEFCDELVRYHLAGAVVAGEALEVLRLVAPVFHYLRRQFDEVAGDVGACQGLIAALGEDAVEGVAELVEEGGELVVGEQGRGVAGRLAKVGDYAYVRAVLHAAAYALAAELRHPRAGPLARPREEVGIKEGEVAAVSVFHVVHLDILVVNRQVAALLEADAVKLACKAEHRIDAGVEREVWLEDLVADAVKAAQLLF